MAEIELKYSEWIKALEFAEIQQPDGLTTDELCEAWGVADGTARKRLKALIKQGRARCSGKRLIPNIAGTPQPANVYSLVKP